MILDVAEIEADLVICGDGGMSVAMPGKTLDNVGFAVQQAPYTDDLPAAFVNLLDDRAYVVYTGKRKAVFYHVDLLLDLLDQRGKPIDDIITRFCQRNRNSLPGAIRALHQGIANPITG